MGAVLAKFRKEKSSADILEKLETDIRAIEKFSLTTQEKQKRLVGNFLVISIGLYAVTFLIFYFVFFPPTWSERITYSVPLLIFPLIIFLLRRLLAWYFQRKLNKNQSKLITLRAEKKRILEEVMEKETYNVASKLLSKYGDKSYGIKSLSATAPTPQSNRLPPPQQENRIQNLNSSLVAQPPQLGGPVQPYNRSLLSANNSQQAISLNTPRSSITTNSGGVLRHRTSPSQYDGTVALARPRPYPIINQKTQGILEKMVDYLIGDGPQNRYALICKECFAHNGMARQEEFEYATFRCAFCNSLNPSRKSRPVAPKLPTTVVSPLNNRMIGLSSRNSDSESSSDSSDDSDVPRRVKEVVPPPAEAEKKDDPAAAGDGINVTPNVPSVPNEESETNQSNGLQSEEKTSPDGDKVATDVIENEPVKEESETKQ